MTDFSRKERHTDQNMKSVCYPLVTDLDGTLIATDLLHESFVTLMRTRPTSAILASLALLRGRSFFKAKLAAQVEIDPGDLPWNSAVVEFLRERHNAGQPIWIATAADERYAKKIAEYLGFVDHVLASSGEDNCKGRRKRELIEASTHGQDYEYIGDSADDIPIFDGARRSWVTGPNADRLVRKRKSTGGQLGRLGPSGSHGVRVSLARLLRPHQWLKNLLVFLPLLAGHGWTDSAAVTGAGVAFLSFCLIASSAYVLNDLLDVPFDRRHPRKRHRPIAGGAVEPLVALAISAGLMIAALSLAWTAGAALAAIVGGYLAVTTAYSMTLKSRPLLDVLTLALLYNMRIMAGAIAAGMLLSYWLVAFTLFLFFGLAVMKRTNELGDEIQTASLGRGYRPSDKQVLLPLGVSASVASTLVLALYMNSASVAQLYTSPHWLWFTIPVMLVWQCGLWLATVRGKMHDDPIVFAIRYPGTWWTGAVVATLFILAL